MITVTPSFSLVSVLEDAKMSWPPESALLPSSRLAGAVEGAIDEFALPGGVSTGEREPDVWREVPEAGPDGPTAAGGGLGEGALCVGSAAERDIPGKLGNMLDCG